MLDPVKFPSAGTHLVQQDHILLLVPFHVPSVQMDHMLQVQDLLNAHHVGHILHLQQDLFLFYSVNVPIIPQKQALATTATIHLFTVLTSHSLEGLHLLMISFHNPFFLSLPQDSNMYIVHPAKKMVVCMLTQEYNQHIPH
jgi:hypothetical protein